ncbi:MAG: hypothetical protein NTY64_10745 [Deltaproteobacteria bacterium]|nr:hypothetical protein [Deltaproteobacteria bacterium]
MISTLAIGRYAFPWMGPNRRKDMAVGRYVLWGTITLLFLRGFFPAPEAFGSPIALPWVQAVVRLENERGQGGSGFLLIRQVSAKQVAMEIPEPYLLGIVSATQIASIRLEEQRFPMLPGLGIVYDAETVREAVELFFK